MTRPGHISPCLSDNCFVCNRSASAKEAIVNASVMLESALHKTSGDIAVKLWKAKKLTDEAYLLNNDSTL